jgi:hypothetical protein
MKLKKILEKGVIIETTHCVDEYISNIFIRPKKDGGHRLILNLAKCNEHVQKRHFKMQTLVSAINLITKGCFMASIDWKDAYYSVPVSKHYQKCLRFVWNYRVFQFTCLPNGLSSAPRIFTKITKPLFSQLRKLGFINSSYIDDAIVFGDTIAECRENITATINLSLDLGFVVHPTKSVFEPTQNLTFLGFDLNSREMTVTLTMEKAQHIKDTCATILNEREITIRELCQLIGLMVASFPGVQYAKL